MMLIYPIFRWTPPEFTLQEQIELGEDIARVGRKAFVTAFKQRLSTWSPGSKPKPFTFADILDDAQTKQQQPPTTPKEWITGLSLISLFLGGFAFIIPYQGLLAAMVFVLPVSLGSLLWTHNKVDRWVQSLIDEYTQSVAKSSAEVRADTPRTSSDACMTQNSSDLAIVQPQQPSAAKRLFPAVAILSIMVVGVAIAGSLSFAALFPAKQHGPWEKYQGGPPSRLELRPLTPEEARTLGLTPIDQKENRADMVYVKYRGEVDLKFFSCTDVVRSSFIRRVCYDRDNEYMLISLNGTFYHYCEIDAGTVSSLLNAPSMGSFYNRSIKGQFDCRLHQVPEY